MDAAIEAGRDTEDLERQACHVEDQMGSELDQRGAAVQEEIKNRPKREPPPSSERLF
ncbi:hypothetical protein [Nocardia sp. SYP-A9097]|uniref:hypothetical protein n=1 Tax=Nocardia sp. SYP-A9097 TaxID=2663237 RepID=UPI00129A73E1|nr:hypothetical protein [Nocardia sp. SYP-A9097]